MIKNKNKRGSLIGAAIENGVGAPVGAFQNVVIKKDEKNNTAKPETLKTEALKNSLISEDFFGAGVDVDISRIFPVVVMATMSSGKSTLVNALLGEEILPNRNEACTAKIFSVLDDDTATENKLYVTRKNGDVDVITEELVKELELANNDGSVAEILLSGDIKGVQNTEKSTLLIDTPGPNNSMDLSHAQITEQILNKINGGIILYVMNATQMGIHDDCELLHMVSDKLKNKENLKVLFVMNKMDELDVEKESVFDFIRETKEYLEKNGFENPEIIPVSALAAVLFKKAANGKMLTRKQQNDFEIMYETYKSEGMRIGVYAAKAEFQKEVEVCGTKYTIGQLERAIENTGLTDLEHKIQEHQILSSGTEALKVNVQKQRKSIFDIDVIATMSSGKSTLINAILGTELLPAKNEACTATIARILDNDELTGEGFEAICYAADERTEIYPKKKVTAEDLQKYNEDPKVTFIDMEGDIAGVSSKKIRLQICDTPGPNNSRNENHGQLIHDIITNENAIVLYVMNATNFVVNDDKALLSSISDEMKRNGKESRDRFIFIVNKCDLLNEEEGETVEKLLKNVREYLKGFHIEDPVLIPTSARLALLIRKSRGGEQLTRRERLELLSVDDFVTNELFHYEKYASLTPSVRQSLETKAAEYHKAEDDWDLEALIHTGIGALEAMISEYLDKYV